MFQVDGTSTTDELWLLIADAVTGTERDMWPIFNSLARLTRSG